MFTSKSVAVVVVGGFLVGFFPLYFWTLTVWRNFSQLCKWLNPVRGLARLVTKSLLSQEKNCCENC